MEYRFRLLNVFSESQFGGNPLCVFEDAHGLSDTQMQTLAAQFNLSETVFVFPPLNDEAQAALRIFTTTNELPFAGHPSLGAAAVVSELQGGRRNLKLECRAGVIEMFGASPINQAFKVAPRASNWTLKAPLSTTEYQRDCFRAPEVEARILADTLGLNEEALMAPPVWVNTGNEHLLIPLKSADDVARAHINPRRLHEWPVSRLGRQNAFVFAMQTKDADNGLADQKQVIEVQARYWFAKHGAVAEDPATGSAAANWAAWCLLQGEGKAVRAIISQGHAMLRPSKLMVSAEIDTNQVPRILVGGDVIEIGSGVLHL